MILVKTAKEVVKGVFWFATGGPLAEQGGALGNIPSSSKRTEGRSGFR